MQIGLNEIAVSDAVLIHFINPAVHIKNHPGASRSGLLYSPAPKKGGGGWEIQGQSIEDMKNGSEVCQFWNKLTSLAIERGKSCSVHYNEAASRVIALEDRKNACYVRGDELKRQRDEVMARLKGIEASIKSVENDISKLDAMANDLNNKVRELEEKKKIYDVLRWIPVVNLFSELAAAIDGTRMELENKKAELKSRREQCSRLHDERKMSMDVHYKLENRISENQCEAKALEEQISSSIAQRENAAKEMIQWKDRERYYLNIAGEMEHLIEMEADIAEFKKLIENNPPPFALAA